MKKNFKILVIVVIGLVFILIGLVSLGSSENKNSPSNKQPKNHNNISSLYEVSVVGEEDFSVATDSYNDGSNLNVFIKSEKNYSYVNIDYDLLNADDRTVGYANYTLNNITAGDELLNNLSIDTEAVRTVKITIVTSDYDPDLVFLDKNKLQFAVEDNLEGKNSVVSISALNMYNADLLFVTGYLMFYKDDKVINVEPFKIENIPKSQMMQKDISLSNIGKYDSIKVIINEVV